MMNGERNLVSTISLLACMVALVKCDLLPLGRWWW